MQTYLSTSLLFPPARPIEIKVPTPVNFLNFEVCYQVVNKYVYIYIIPPFWLEGGGGFVALVWWLNF